MTVENIESVTRNDYEESNTGGISIDFVKKTLESSFLGEIKTRLLLFFTSLSSYRDVHLIVIVKGPDVRMRNEIVRSVLNLHPDKAISVNSERGAKCRKTLVHKRWDKEKVLYLSNFKKNEGLLLKFLQGDWTFQYTSRSEGIEFTESKKLRPMTVFSTVGIERSNRTVLNNSLLIELRNSKIQSQKRSASIYKEAKDYYLKVKEQEGLEEKSLKIRDYIARLDKSIAVEVPFEEIIRKNFRFSLLKNELYHALFLELVKNITFFFQERRAGYKIKNTDKTVIFSDFTDLKLAYEIAGATFLRITQNLNPKHLAFLEFVINWLHKNTPNVKDSFIDKKKFQKSLIAKAYNTYLGSEHVSTIVPRTVSNWLEILVENRCLEKEKKKGKNWYWLSDAPSLKEPDLKEDAKQARVLIEKRKKAVLANNKLQGLRDLINLETLYLNRNPLESIRGIESLINLKTLYLDDTNLTSVVSELDNLPNLKFLSIKGRLGHIPFEEMRYLIEEKGIDILPYGIPPYDPAN